VAFDQAAEYRFSLRRPAHYGEAVAGSELKFGIVGIEARGALKRRERLREALQTYVSVGEIGLIAGMIRLYCNRSPQHFDGSGRVTPLQRDESEQVHGVRMPGRKFQRALAGLPGMFNLPLPELSQPGFE